MSTDENLFVTLPGMMGCGKTTVTGELSRRLGARAFDLDEIIQVKTGRTISELFAQGERMFREAERATLDALVQPVSPRTGIRVIALGGGALTHNPTRALAFSAGPSVYLRCSSAVLIERLSVDQERKKRPLLAGKDWKDRLRSLLESRAEVYEQCSIIVDAEAKPAQVAESIVEALRAHDEQAERKL